MRRLGWFLALATLTGCAIAPRSPAVRVATDPIASAFLIAHQLPASGQRTIVLNAVAVAATTCDRPAPTRFWAHDWNRSRAALRLAWEGLAARDTAGAIRAARDAWSGSESEDGSAASLLLDAGAYHEILDRLDAHPRARLGFGDAGEWRAEIAERAARAGDDLTVRRSGDLVSAARSRALVLARASDWEAALVLAAFANGSADCARELDFGLMRIADAAGRTELADSLASALIARARAGDRPQPCNPLHPTVWPLDVVADLARTGRFADAESLLAMPRWMYGFEPLGWVRVAIERRERGEVERADRALARAFAATDPPSVEAWTAAEVFAAMSDTLLDAGWEDAARAAFSRAIASARREERPAYQALAFGRIAAYDRGGSAAGWIKEAIDIVRTIPDPETQARMLADVGASARVAGVTMDAEEGRWLAEMVNARPPWTPTLSE
jgi:hypothetical protein